MYVRMHYKQNQGITITLNHTIIQQ